MPMIQSRVGRRGPLPVPQSGGVAHRFCQLERVVGYGRRNRASTRLRRGQSVRIFSINTVFGSTSQVSRQRLIRQRLLIRVAWSGSACPRSSRLRTQAEPCNNRLFRTNIPPVAAHETFRPCVTLRTDPKVHWALPALGRHSRNTCGRLGSGLPRAVFEALQKAARRVRGAAASGNHGFPRGFGLKVRRVSRRRRG